MLSGLLPSCAPVQANQASARTPQTPAQTIVLAPGQVERVAGTPVTITLSGVGEDSRCPEGVDCVWAGDVSVTLRLEARGTPTQDVTLRLNTSPRDVMHGDHRVTVAAVAPHPKAGEKIEPKSYRVTMRVEAR